MTAIGCLVLALAAGGGWGCDSPGGSQTGAQVIDSGADGDAQADSEPSTEVVADAGPEVADAADTVGDATSDGAGDATPDTVADAPPDGGPDGGGDTAADLEPGDAPDADASAGCPTAVIAIAEGAKVTAGVKLHLDASSSVAIEGESIATYQWSVQQPGGSAAAFAPDTTSEVVTFQPTVLGSYTFTLDVWDTAGSPACAPAEVTVEVVAGPAIHVQLVWSTPGDPDETDTGPEAGSDLDLHLAHPLAVGTTDGDGDGVNDGWYDDTYDCYWDNPSPSWGSTDPTVPDDPSLDLEDTDGAGPENTSLAWPEVGEAYRIGVDYWNDHGFGDSFATVRVWVWGTLVYEAADVKLSSHDFWEVAAIEWPSGLVTPIEADGGGPKIMSNYADPILGGN